MAQLSKCKYRDESVTVQIEVHISGCKCLEYKILGLKSLGSIVKAEMSRSKNPRSKVEVKLPRSKCRSAIVSVPMSKAQKSRVYVSKAQISRRMSFPLGDCPPPP